MKTKLLSTVIATFGLFAFASLSEAASAGAVFSRLPVEGIEAQFILETLQELKSVRGLEDIGECDLDLCTFEIRKVICTKAVSEPAGSLENPSVGLGCYIAPPSLGAAQIHVLHDENPAVSKLRRAMIEKTRRLQHTTDSNEVKVDSISCTARAMGRHELETLRTEPVYSCEIQYQ